MNIDGKDVRKGVLLPLGDAGTGARAPGQAIGLTVMTLGDEMQVGAVNFGSPAEKLGLEQGFKYRRASRCRPTARTRNGCSCRRWLLLGLIVVLQRARRERAAPAAAPAKS